MSKFVQFILYLLFAVVVSLIAGLSQKKANFVSQKAKVDGAYREKSKYNKSWLIFAFLILWLFYTLSGDWVGIDMYTYGYLFRDAISNFDMYMSTSDMEPFFHVFNFAVRSITNNFYVYKGICGILVLVGPYKIINMHNDKLWVSLALFIYILEAYFESFNLMRLYIALSMVLLGTAKLYRKKYIQNIIFCLVGSLFHFSALIAAVFAIIYLLYNFVIKNNKILYIVICLALLVIINLYMEQILSLLGLSRYYYYLSNNESGIMNFWFMKYLFGAFILFYFYNHKNVRRDYDLYGYYFINSLVLQVFSFKVEIATRAITYTRVSNFIFLPMLLRQSNVCAVEKRLLTAMTVIWFVLWFYYGFTRGYDYTYMWTIGGFL